MTQPLRVLALVTDAFGGHGGIAQYNRDFLTALADMPGIACVIVLPRQGDGAAFIPRGISQQKPHRSRIAYALATLTELLRGRVDLVFCGHLFLAPLALLLARIKRAKLVVQLHGIEAWLRPTRLRRTAVDQADLALCVSRHTRAAVLGWSTIAPERVVIVPNTVGTMFRPGDRATMRQRHDLAGKRVLLTVARMDSRERYKGHDRIFAAIPALVQAGHDIVYLIAGSGDDRQRLETLAREAGVGERVRFLGHVPPRELIDLYCAADLFVMPSTGEGFGIAFLEAAACGTPTVGLLAGGARDALGDGELGHAVRAEDLTATLLRLLAEPEPDRDALSAAAHARFGHDTFLKHVRSALDRLFDLRPPCQMR